MIDPAAGQILRVARETGNSFFKIIFQQLTMAQCPYWQLSGLWPFPACHAPHPPILFPVISLSCPISKALKT